MNSTYARESGSAAFLGNDLIELGLSRETGLRLISIRDKKSGCDLIRFPDASADLFRLAYRDPKDGSTPWLESRDARDLVWRTEDAEGGKKLVIEATGFAAHPELMVTITISLADDSALSVWRAKISASSNLAVYGLTCPNITGVMKVGDAAPDEVFVGSLFGEGRLFKNPFPLRDGLPLKAGASPSSPAVGVGSFSAIYPGRATVQMMLYYHSECGLYLGTHDATQQAKLFELTAESDGGAHPALRITHLPIEACIQEVGFEYDTVLGVFHGDWYAGADIYKSWARQQWWCEKPLWQRELPEWMRSGFGVFQMSNYHMPELRLNHSMNSIADVVNSLSTEIGAPLFGLVFNWEGGGAWTGPSGYFPPREGEDAFRASFQKMADAGNYGFAYVPGGNWYIDVPGYIPPYDDNARFETEGRPNCIRDYKGQVLITDFLCEGHQARMCPERKLTGDLTCDLVTGLIERGCPIVQIDNVPISGAEECYDPTHGHPLGNGSWWAESWGRILAECRQRAFTMDKRAGLSTEGVTESFIPYLDLYDERSGAAEMWRWPFHHPSGGEVIPLFKYIYSGYIGAYASAYLECNRPEVLYWTRCLGKSLAFGVVPTGGKYYPEPKEFNPVTLEFFREITRATVKDCWKYIMFGEMMHPLRFESPRIQAKYLPFASDFDHFDKEKVYQIEDAAIQHSAWKALDGSVGYIFVNISGETHCIKADWRSGMAADRRYAAWLISKGQRTELFLQDTLSLELPAFSVVLVELSSLD